MTSEGSGPSAREPGRRAPGGPPPEEPTQRVPPPEDPTERVPPPPDRPRPGGAVYGGQGGTYGRPAGQQGAQGGQQGAQGGQQGGPGGGGVYGRPAGAGQPPAYPTEGHPGDDPERTTALGAPGYQPGQAQPSGRGGAGGTAYGPGQAGAGHGPGRYGPGQGGTAYGPGQGGTAYGPGTGGTPYGTGEPAGPPGATGRRGMSRNRLLLVIGGAAVAVIALVAVAIVAFGGGNPVASDPFKVGSCVVRSGDAAKSADCSADGAYKISNRVPSFDQCPDQSQPHVDVKQTGKADAVLCLTPAKK